MTKIHIEIEDLSYNQCETLNFITFFLKNFASFIFKYKWQALLPSVIFVIDFWSNY